MKSLEPRLLPTLRVALSNLYGLGNGGGDTEPSPHSLEAHSYLMRFQSRNLRRKIQSFQQSERDSVSPYGLNPESFQDKIVGIIGDDYGFGSVFFTCVAIVSRPHLFNETERLFCAQSLLGRIRRMPTYQAFDLEFEYENVSTLHYYFTFDSWKYLMTLYSTTLSCYHPALGQTLSQYEESIDGGSLRNSPANEERLKGELAMIWIACLIFIQNGNSQTSHTANCSEPCHDPITSTLSAAIAIVALRLRCTIVYNAQNILDDGKYNLVQVVVQVLNQTRAYFDIHPAYFAICVCSSLAMIPDAIFGSPGGARGKLSLDPKQVRACYRELNENRRGVESLKETFHGLSILSHYWTGSKELSVKVDYHLLTVCERWAKFLTLPFDFVEMTIPLVERYSNSSNSNSSPATQRMGFCYFIRLFEGACMEAEDIHAMYLGLSSEQLDSSDQDGRTRQRSKSKRRLKERVESASLHEGGEFLLAQAGREAFDRGEVACHSALLLWSNIFKSVDAGLESLNDGDMIDGEGEIGCLLACISACVPHIIEFACETKYTEVLHNLICSAGKVCCNSSRYVRSHSLDIMEKIHSALVTRTHLIADMNAISELEKSIACFVCECSIQLADKCAYPLNYFVDMTEESDEDIENERNDVRDLLRSICDVENPVCHSSNKLSLLILENILGNCLNRLNDTPIESAEAIVHILSSLAKPVNWISHSLHPAGTLLSIQALKLTITSFHKVCGILLAFLSSPSPSLLAFSVIRLVSLAIGSFAPTFHCIGVYLNQRSDEYNAFPLYHEMLGLAASVALVSLHKVPELLGDNSQAIITHLNIKGAMRAPGGEDHVSCIALMRLSFESENLAVYWLDAAANVQGITSDDVLLTLIRVHDDLKLAELQRGPGIEHGQGVTPKTRRLLLNIIAQLVLKLHGKIAMLDSTRSRVHSLFWQNYEYISQIYDRRDISTEEKMFHICEATFDLASFPPDLIYSSLCPTSTYLNGFSCIIQMVLSGYSLQTYVKGGFLDLKFQWSRLRAALFTFLQECIKIMLPRIVAESLTAIIITECNTITSHLYDNTENLSQLMLIDPTSGDTIFPSGAFLRVLADYFHIINTKLRNNISSVEVVLENISSSILILTMIEKAVYTSLSSLQPETVKYTDPRPTLAESWFQTLSHLLLLMDNTTVSAHKFEHLEELVFQANKLAVQIIFFHEIDETSTNHSSMGMSVDGPQTFAMMNFLQYSCKSFGMNTFTSIAAHFQGSIQLDIKPIIPDYHLGGIMLCGALFRAFSGSLPPWIIENAPELYFAIYQACGSNMDFFHSIMVTGSEVKIKENSSTFNHIRQGDKLGGLVQTQQIQQLRSILKTESDFRQLKASIKAACGGKKKSSSFFNKPTITTWQFDRI